MKKWTIIIFVFPLLSACKKEEARIQLGIDVQSFFDKDSLQLWLDNRQVFSREVTTNASLGAALKEDGSITTLLNLKKGSHTISVRLQKNVQSTETFTLKAPLYIGINYDRELNKLQLAYSNERFAYD